MPDDPYKPGWSGGMLPTQVSAYDDPLPEREQQARGSDLTPQELFDRMRAEWEADPSYLAEKAPVMAIAFAAIDAAVVERPDEGLLATDDSEIEAVPDAKRRAWEPRRTGYSRENFDRDRAARAGPDGSDDQSPRDE